MEYNSQKETLVMPEYGRNVQNLVKYAKTIEDPKLRQAFAERIIELMNQMHPQNRNLDDYRVKLWKHIFQIAEFELEGIEPPIGYIPKPEDKLKRPEMIGYPKSEAKFRHYGNNVQRLINKALEMEDGPKKDAFVQVIGSYMKLAYNTWNKEHYVSDEVIRADLESLSNGQLILKEDIPLDNLAGANRRSKRSQSSNGKSYRKGGKRRK